MDDFFEWVEPIAAGGAAILLASGVLGFFLKGVIQNWLNQDLERFKIQTKASVDLDLARFRIEAQAMKDAKLEQLRSDLAAAQARDQTRYSGLHERRLEIIGDSYCRLVQTQKLVGYMIGGAVEFGDDPTKEQRLEAYQALQGFGQYIDERRIWLDEESYLALNRALKRLRTALEDSNTASSQDEKAAAWKIVVKDVSVDIVDVIGRFRTTLGD